MRERVEPSTQYAWIVNAAAMLLVGGLAGYILALQGRIASAGVAPAAVASVATAPAPMADEAQLRAYREILARDPKNVAAAISAGNLLYDAQRYSEAIGYYQQGFAGNPSDINVSTDLGTALWYTGRADDALAQYAKSLAINPTHGQTLFNVGIVRNDGKHDHAGAVEAWEKLLASNPAYPDATRVRTMIADARQKATSTR
jgi:tetratricopeptide (TPR) repeat protein